MASPALPKSYLLIFGSWMIARIRILTVIDQYTRECHCLDADTSLSGEKVAAALNQVIAETKAASGKLRDETLAPDRAQRNYNAIKEIVQVV